MNDTCEFENGSSRVCERGTWGCVVNHDRLEEPFVQTSPGVYRESAPTKPAAPSVTINPVTLHRCEVNADCLHDEPCTCLGVIKTSDPAAPSASSTEGEIMPLPEWMKIAAQDSADDIIAAMLRIRLSKEDVAQLILARLTAAYEAQKGKP